MSVMIQHLSRSIPMVTGQRTRKRMRLIKRACFRYLTVTYHSRLITVQAPASAGAIPSASASSFPSSSEAPGDAAPVDGRCQNDTCDEVATWCYCGGEVQFCQSHSYKTPGWAPKVVGRRKRKPSAKVKGANTGALDDDEDPDAKKRRVRDCTQAMYSRS